MKKVKKVFNVGTIASIMTLVLILGFVIYAYQMINDNSPDFDINQPVEVVNKTVTIGDYLDLSIERCRYTDQPAYIARSLVYPNGTRIVIATVEDPDIRRYDPNCIENGKEISIKDKIKQPNFQPLAGRVFIPKVVKGSISDEPVVPGCNVYLTSTILTSSFLFSKAKAYEYTTETFCLVEPSGDELLTGVDVLIDRGGTI